MRKESDASCFALGTYKELVSQTLGLYPIISVRTHIVTIDNNGVPNKIAINHVTNAPTMQTLTNRSHFHNTDNHQHQSSRVSDKPAFLSNKCTENSDQPYESEHKQNIDCIACHVGAEPTVKDELCSDNYSTYDHTINTAKATSHDDINIDRSMHVNFPRPLENVIFLRTQNKRT